jgi:hypothetical protein
MKKELILQKQIQLDCGKHGWIAEHYESKKLRLPNGMYADSGVPKGYPDITIYIGNGIVVFVETKIGYNKLSDDQKKFFKRMRRLGYICEVVYTVKQWSKVKDKIVNEGLGRKY